MSINVNKILALNQNNILALLYGNFKEFGLHWVKPPARQVVFYEKDYRVAIRIRPAPILEMDLVYGCFNAFLFCFHPETSGQNRTIPVRLFLFQNGFLNGQNMLWFHGFINVAAFAFLSVSDFLRDAKRSNNPLDFPRTTRRVEECRRYP